MRNAPDYRYSMSPACRETRVLYRRYRRGPKRPRCRGHADGIFCIRGGYGYRRARANDVHYVPHLAVAQNPFDRSPPQPVYDHPDAPAWVAEVTLYRDTWFDKITKNHLEMLGKEDAVRLVVSSPTAVCVASSNPSYRVFINDSVRSPGGRSLLTVYVDPVPAVVVSAYYNRSFPRLSSDRIIWQAIDKRSTASAQMTADYDQSPTNLILVPCYAKHCGLGSAFLSARGDPKSSSST